MVLIDSATDLLAMESGGQYSGAQYEAIQPQLLHPEVFSDPWSDIYLQGAYEKRVQELEQFAQDKNYDYLSLEKGVRIQNKHNRTFKFMNTRCYLTSSIHTLKVEIFENFNLRGKSFSFSPKMYSKLL